MGCYFETDWVRRSEPRLPNDVLPFKGDTMYLLLKIKLCTILKTVKHFYLSDQINNNFKKLKNNRFELDLEECPILLCLNLINVN